MKHYFIGDIAEINIKQPHIPHKAGICDRAVMMRMPPRPNACAFFAFGYIAVFVNICVYKRNIAVVRFGLFIHKLEYTLCARHSHNHRVYLLRNLAYAHGKLTRHVKERHHHRHRNRLTRKRKVGRVCNNQNTADKGYKHIQNIAYVAHYRHQYICKNICTFGIFEQLIVYFVEILFAFFLMAEYLNDLLSVHHFLNIALNHTYRLLLPYKITRAVSAYFFCYHSHGEHAEEYHKGHPNA